MTLKMACPVGKKVLIKTVDGAIETIKDPKSQSTRLLMMTRNCVDALRVVKACGDLIPEVNLPTPDILKQTERHADDIAAAKELVEILGDKFYTQMVPTTPKRLIKDLL
jgi:PTS system mannose-specific IIB component